jgi:hypothetical protein
MTTPDPLFGDLHSTRVPGDADYLWAGAATFAPTGQLVTYQFQAPRDGPTEGHRDLLHRIQSRYPALLPRLLALLAAERPGAGAEAAAAPPGGFRLVEIWLPEREDVAMEWDFTFEDEASGDQYMVDMRGWEPLGVEIA